VKTFCVLLRCVTAVRQSEAGSWPGSEVLGGRINARRSRETRRDVGDVSGGHYSLCTGRRTSGVRQLDQRVRAYRAVTVISLIQTVTSAVWRAHSNHPQHSWIGKQ